MIQIVLYASYWIHFVSTYSTIVFEIKLNFSGTCAIKKQKKKKKILNIYPCEKSISRFNCYTSEVQTLIPNMIMRNKHIYKD